MASRPTKPAFWVVLILLLLHAGELFAIEKISIVDPKDGGIVGDSYTVTLLTHNNPEPKRVAVFLEDRSLEWTDPSGNYEGVLDLSGLPDGPYKMVAQIVDAMGNQDAQIIDVIKQTHVPGSVEVQSPAPGAVVTSPMHIKATCDNCGDLTWELEYKHGSAADAGNRVDAWVDLSRFSPGDLINITVRSGDDKLHDCGTAEADLSRCDKGVVVTVYYEVGPSDPDAEDAAADSATASSGGCSVGRSDGVAPSLLLLLLALAGLAIRRRRLAGILAVAALIVIGGCGQQEGGSGAAFVLLDEGGGPANEEPLWPLVEGTLPDLSDHYQTPELARVVTSGEVDGVETAYVSNGANWHHLTRTDEGLALVASGLEGPRSVPILVVPDTIRVGMRWRVVSPQQSSAQEQDGVSYDRKGVYEFLVRQVEEADTAFGRRRAWSITWVGPRRGYDKEFVYPPPEEDELARVAGRILLIEGVGLAREGFQFDVLSLMTYDDGYHVYEPQDVSLQGHLFPKDDRFWSHVVHESSVSPAQPESLPLLSLEVASHAEIEGEKFAARQLSVVNLEDGRIVVRVDGIRHWMFPWYKGTFQQLTPYSLCLVWEDGLSTAPENEAIDGWEGDFRPTPCVHPRSTLVATSHPTLQSDMPVWWDAQGRLLTIVTHDETEYVYDLEGEIPGDDEALRYKDLFIEVDQMLAPLDQRIDNYLSAALPLEDGRVAIISGIRDAMGYQPLVNTPGDRLETTLIAPESGEVGETYTCTTGMPVHPRRDGAGMEFWELDRFGRVYQISADGQGFSRRTVGRVTIPEGAHAAGAVRFDDSRLLVALTFGNDTDDQVNADWGNLPDVYGIREIPKRDLGDLVLYWTDLPADLPPFEPLPPAMGISSRWEAGTWTLCWSAGAGKLDADGWTLDGAPVAVEPAGDHCLRLRPTAHPSVIAVESHVASGPVPGVGPVTWVLPSHPEALLPLDPENPSR